MNRKTGHINNCTTYIDEKEKIPFSVHIFSGLFVTEFN